MWYNLTRKPRVKLTFLRSQISRITGNKLWFYKDRQGNQYMMWNESSRRYNDDGSYSTVKTERWRKAVA